MRTQRSAALLAFVSTFGVGACTPGTTSAAAPTTTVTQTVTTTATATVTATVDRTVEVKVTAPPRTVEVAAPAAGPLVITDAYRAWRAKHYDAQYPDDATQYQRVVQATIDAGVLEVLTDMRPNWGGWNCTGEPTQIAGQTVTFVRVLNSDSSVFRLCQVS